MARANVTERRGRPPRVGCCCAVKDEPKVHHNEPIGSADALRGRVGLVRGAVAKIRRSRWLRLAVRGVLAPATFGRLPDHYWRGEIRLRFERSLGIGDLAGKGILRIAEDLVS